MTTSNSLLITDPKAYFIPAATSYVEIPGNKFFADTLCIALPRHCVRIGKLWLHKAGAKWEDAEEIVANCRIKASGKIGESCTLVIEQNNVTIAFDSHPVDDVREHNGLRLACTLAGQLSRVGQNGMPCGTYTFTPAFQTRGVMIDVSRTRIPTMAEFTRIFDTLGLLGFNHVQLYTEHTFAYVGHEKVWNGQSAITPDELRQLDQLAHERGLELAANQNCFGHLAHWLNTEGYKHLAETHGDWMFDVWPRSGAFSLCPTDEQSVTFISGLLDQLLPCVTSKHVNIGCDETYDIGYGRSAHAVAMMGRRAVYLDYVERIAHECRIRGKQAQFWADVLLPVQHNSEEKCTVDRLPPDLLALAWGYEPSSPFERWGKALNNRKGAGFWVCPGTSCWRSITGRSTERNINLTVAMDAGIKYGACGFLVCDWGDTGHHQTWPIVLHALIDAAHAAWGVRPDRLQRCAAESLHYFGGVPLGEWIEQLGDIDAPLRAVCGPLSHPSRVVLLNQTALFIDMFKKGKDGVDTGPLRLWQDAFDKITLLEKLLPVTGDQLIDEECSHTAMYTRYAIERAIARRENNGTIPIVQRNLLRSKLSEIRKNHARLWKIRSRIGGLTASNGFFDQIDAALMSEDAKAYENA